MVERAKATEAYPIDILKNISRLSFADRFKKINKGEVIMISDKTIWFSLEFQLLSIMTYIMQPAWLNTRVGKLEAKCRQAQGRSQGSL